MHGPAGVQKALLSPLEGHSLQQYEEAKGQLEEGFTYMRCEGGRQTQG